MKILMHFRHFPVAMGRFIHWGFQDLGHEVYTVGPWSRGTIPWGDFYYPQYKFPPDREIPDGDFALVDVLNKIDFKPDIVVQAADTSWLTGKSPIPNIIIGTDPHVIDYTPRLEYADYFFCMQKHYMPHQGTFGPRIHWMPYAYDTHIHKNRHFEEEYDVMFCGLQYEHRVSTLLKMQEAGLKVKNTLGLIYREYVDAYNKGLIAFNWSSKEDLPARFWEGLAMNRLVLTNRVPDLKDVDLREDIDYVAFSSAEEAVEKAKFYVSHDSERLRIARNGYKHVKDHTYKNRCQELLSLI